jgi:protein-S-isoprenylcysteine O-methyltransferase Ste14
MEKFNLYELFVFLSGLFVFLTSIYLFVKDVQFRKWLMASWEEENGRASGKSLTAFVMSALLLYVVIAAVNSSENKLIPEWMFWGIIILISSLYGIKLATKYTWFNNFKKDNINHNEKNLEVDSKNKEDKENPYNKEPLV